MDTDRVHAAFRTARSELRTDEAIDAFDSALLEYEQAAFDRGYEQGSIGNVYRAAGPVGSIRDTRPDTFGRTEHEEGTMGTRTLEDIAASKDRQYIQDLRLGAAALRFQGVEEGNRFEQEHAFFMAAERLEDLAVLIEKGLV
jgi:hypothetical protein